jgi:hypothetical protein
MTIKGFSMAAPETVYHYTTGKALGAILRSGFLEPSPSFSRATEKPVVWCSIRKDWEPSAACIQTLPDGRVIRRTKEEIRKQEGGLVRIALLADARMFHWEQYKRISRISPKHLRILTLFAQGCGADPQDWRVSFHPLPARFWACVEMEDARTGVWQPLSLRTGADLASLLREIRSCLPAMGEGQRVRLHTQLERLGAFWARGA